jgi:hypothetical protein
MEVRQRLHWLRALPRHSRQEPWQGKQVVFRKEEEGQLRQEAESWQVLQDEWQGRQVCRDWYVAEGQEL